LEGVYQLPPDIINCMFDSLSAWYGEKGAVELFEEEWLRDCNDRWQTLASLVRDRHVDASVPALPTVIDEVGVVLFAIKRAALQNSTLLVNLQQSDERALAVLTSGGRFARQRSSGDDNNCLIHTLAEGLKFHGFLDYPAGSRRDLCRQVREHFIATPGLHLCMANGTCSQTAFLEHFMHGSAAVQQLMRLRGKCALPDDGIGICVRARYDTLESPPDSIHIAAPDPGVKPKIVIHAYNWTGNGCSGYHYDWLRPLPRGNAEDIH
jgi:hypothetical protein